MVDIYFTVFIHVVLHLGSNMELRKKQKQMEKELDQEAEVLSNSYYQDNGYVYTVRVMVLYMACPLRNTYH